jgi:hypothetical protein
MQYKKLITAAMLLAVSPTSHGQLLKNILSTNKSAAPNNEPLIQALRNDVAELSQDKYTGRLIGTPGYNNVTAHIEKRMSEIGLTRYGTIGYKSVFKYVTGRSATVESRFLVNNKNVVINTDVLPLPFCANEDNNSYIIPGTIANYTAWLTPLFDLPGNHEFNEKSIQPLIKKILNAQDRGATALYLYDDSNNGIDLKTIKTYCNLPINREIKIPVWIISKTAYNDYFKGVDYFTPVFSSPKFRNDFKEGYNIAGTINNNAASTIVIMADYDQLYAGNKGEVLNGANGNASGVATLLQLASLLKAPEYKQYNYAFVAFSGGQMGTLGAQSFLNIPNIKSKIAYAIDITAVGKLNERSEIYINGAGTAATFAPAIKGVSAEYNPKVGEEYPHTASYTKFIEEQIPTLSFSTGYNQQFIAETDKISGINFAGMATVTRYIMSVIGSVNKTGVPSFSSQTIAVTDKDLSVEKAVVTSEPATKAPVRPVQKPATTATTQPVASAKKPVKRPSGPKNNAPITDPNYRGAKSIVKDVLGLGINELDAREGGAYIYSIDTPGKGSELGFKEGDVVLQIGSIPVFNAKSYLITIQKFKSGERTYFKVKKSDGQTAMINVDF